MIYMIFFCAPTEVTVNIFWILMSVLEIDIEFFVWVIEFSRACEVGTYVGAAKWVCLSSSDLMKSL